ncbi:helix-turn-helix transcriptional regulator (plasmid) [Nostoc sp. UHCC 0302]|uniref:helix-turn-helix domain-containing protein n=1 Tax=Nostoc sp. UHCC 0302 TaxID=3134896 RepID=UPI00311CDF49
MNLMQVTLSVDLPSLGSRIREIRESKGLSPTWVAAQAGMSVGNLYRIETEEAKSLPRETLRKLSEALGVDFDAEVKAALVQEVR